MYIYIYIYTYDKHALRRLAIYVDDRASEDVAPFAVFQQRFLHGLPQLDPVLTAFADVIISLYDHYDVYVMNTILTATFDFVNSSCMEPTVESLPLIREAGSFPWYLRDQTGIGKAFTLFMFTKSSKVVITDYIQAIPNMNYWIACVNDFLSFVLPFVLAREFADPTSYDLADFTRKNWQGKQGITYITVRMWRASPQCKFMPTWDVSCLRSGRPYILFWPNHLMPWNYGKSGNVATCS